MTILKTENLGKAYPVYQYDWQRAARWFGIPFRPIHQKWVLRHINITVQAGEAIGVIGQNGAGKSTLLKLLTGTLMPTEGGIYQQGRVAAILELGMGFNFELTARQNACFAMQLMGITRQDAKALLPDIEAFCEIGDSFDQPMRVYSSGMQMRVAFAVATAYRPDLLIIDEALSVGDAYFQHKSFQRIRSFHEQGTTLFFVSHDKGAIQALCDRALLLEKGVVIRDDSPESVFDHYNALLAERDNKHIDFQTLANGKVQVLSGTGDARVTDIQLYNKNDEPVHYVEVGEAVTLKIRVQALTSLDGLVLGYAIKDHLGQIMYGTNTWHTGQVLRKINTAQTVMFRVNFLANLGVGSYTISTALTATDSHIAMNYEWKDQAFIFNVMNHKQVTFEGNCWMDPKIEVTTHE